ncbi:Uncharacterised protein [Rhodococcus wratislaviensis]|uniref:Uncharacterized protein n=1 Tax=Rhodococcus wratislaviensis TaxID=44752 RepID=A0AB38FFV3_RHOWR|nr:Uncharacterised protein [Rhodococcus wratislaviensis]
MTQHRRHVGGDDVQHSAVPLTGVQRPQLLGQAGRGIGGSGAATTDTEHPAQDRRQRLTLGSGGPRREPYRHDQRTVHGESSIEQGQTRLRADGVDAAALQPVEIGRIQMGRHPAGPVPQPPGHGRRRQPAGAPVLRECVEEDIRRRIVRLAGAAEHTRRRGEQHERGQVAVPGEFVQMPGTVHLGTKDGVQLLRGQRGGGGVLEHPGGMDHAGQVGNAGEESGHRGAVGDVAGDSAHLRPRLGELGTQFGRTLGIERVPAGQHQPAHSVPRDEVAGDQPADGSRAASDQDGAVRAEECGSRFGRRRGGHRGEHGRQQYTVPDGQLRFVAGQGHGDQRRVSGVHVQVHQRDAVRVLVLYRADQSPRGGGRHVVDRFVVADRHREPRRDQQAGLGQAIFAEPGLDRPQRRLRGGVRARRHVRLVARFAVEPQHTTFRITAGKRLLERHQVCRRSAGRAHRHPLHAVEAVPDPGGRHTRVPERPQRQRFGGQHRSARRVVRGDPVALGAGRGDVHAQRGGAHRVQLHLVPGKRQPDTGVHGSERNHVQRRVEHRRVDPIPRDRRSRVFAAQPHLAVQVVAATPRRPETPEGRAVLVAGLVEHVVQTPDIDRRGTSWRPVLFGRVCGVHCCRERAGGVPGPRSVLRGIRRPGVHRHRRSARLTVGEHAHLQRHLTLGGNHQGCLDGEFLQSAAPHTVPRVQGELHESRARQNDGAADTVVAQPWKALWRQQTREHGAPAVAELDRRGEHRVSTGFHARGREIALRNGAFQPVAAVLEGVRGQVHPLLPIVVASPAHPIPLDVQSVHLRLGECGGELAQARAVASDGADRSAGDARRVEGFLQRHGEDRVAARLDEQSIPVRGQ